MLQIKKKKSKYLIWGIILVLILGISFLSMAYVHGKNVVNNDIKFTWVSHTEYWRDDNASTIVRLSDYRGNPYPIDECRVTILHPDKSIFVDNAPMAESNIPGNWYRTDSLVGQPLGTYEQEVTCTSGNRTIKTSQSFHLNAALEQISVLTDKSDNLDLKLSDVNVAVTGKVAATGDVITTNLTDMNTSLNTLLNDVNSNFSAKLQDGIATLQTDLADVNVSVTGTVLSTGQEVKTSLSDVNTNLSNLLTNVNNGISSQIDLDYNSLKDNLNDVNLSLTGTVLSTGQEINTNITTASTNITDLLNTVNNNLSDQVGEDFNALSNNLTNVNLSLTSTMESTGQDINTNLTNVSTSLTDLLNTVNSDLSTKMDAKFAELSGQLADVNLSLTGTIVSTGQDINTNLTNVSTSLTNLLNTVNVNLSSEITNQFNNTNALIAQKFADSNDFLNTKIDNLEFSVNGKVDSTGQAIQTQITDVNNSLSDLITGLVVGDLNVQLSEMLDQITAEVASVKEDTTWLVSNAMNQDNMQEVRNRFASIDSNLALVEDFCSTADTNNSALCQEVYSIKNAIAIMDQEQSQKLDEINTTTLNTWDLLSGSIATNINTILTDVGIIKAQTTDINATVHQILDNQESDISIRVIS